MPIYHVTSLGFAPRIAAEGVRANASNGGIWFYEFANSLPPQAVDVRTIEIDHRTYNEVQADYRNRSRDAISDLPVAVFEIDPRGVEGTKLNFGGAFWAGNPLHSTMTVLNLCGRCVWQSLIESRWLTLAGRFDGVTDFTI